MSDNELGVFLRTRREAVAPGEVGLPNGGRRRTPGLRRAELATLAGVSVDYLVRLEQGRDRRPSAQVLGALADAMRLSPDDRMLLHRTAKAVAGYCQAGRAPAPPARSVRPGVRAVLDRLDPTPAVVLNRLGDVLASTAGYEKLAGTVGLLDAEPPSLVRFMFTDARARTVYPEWDRVADAHVAHLKIESNRTDPHVAELVGELAVTAGAPFIDRWHAPPAVLPAGTGVERLVHPQEGELALAYETLNLPDPDDQRLLVYLAADDATVAALDRLTS